MKKQFRLTTLFSLEIIANLKRALRAYKEAKDELIDLVDDDECDITEGIITLEYRTIDESTGKEGDWKIYQEYSTLSDDDSDDDQDDDDDDDQDDDSDDDQDDIDNDSVNGTDDDDDDDQDDIDNDSVNGTDDDDDDDQDDIDNDSVNGTDDDDDDDQDDDSDIQGARIIKRYLDFDKKRLNKGKFVALLDDLRELINTKKITKSSKYAAEIMHIKNELVKHIRENKHAKGLILFTLDSRDKFISDAFNGK